MTPASTRHTTPVRATFSAAEKRVLALRARVAGQTLEAYIRERVITESGCEDRVFRFLADEISRSVDEAQRAIAALEAQGGSGSEESRKMRDAHRGRIVKEMRESFTQCELDALASLFELALDARLGPSHGESAGLRGEKE